MPRLGMARPGQMRKPKTPDATTKKRYPLSIMSTTSFWLTGWHRAYHKLDHHTPRYAEDIRLKRSRAAAKFTLAEWRFHYDR